MTKGEAVLQLRDTLSGATRPFVPLNPDQIGIYSCGPTIYGPAHIGNFRSFLFADLLVRLHALPDPHRFGIETGKCAVAWP